MEAEKLMRFLFENLIGSSGGQFWVGLGAMALGFSIIAYDVLIWRKDRAAAKRKKLDRRDRFRDMN
jgi:hypothetical protein